MRDGFEKGGGQGREAAGRAGARLAHMFSRARELLQLGHIINLGYTTIFSNKAGRVS